MPKKHDLNLLFPGALALVALAFVLAAMALPAGRKLFFGIGLATIAVLALTPLLLARMRLAIDRPLYILICLLSGLGLLFLCRLQLNDPRLGNLAQRQFWALLLGIVAMGAGIFAGRRHQALVQYRYLLLLGALLFLSLTITPLGIFVSGTRAWLRLGNMHLQPSEFVRPVLIFFLASYLGQYQPLLRAQGPAEVPVWRRRWLLGLILGIWALSLIILLYQRDLGTAVLYFAALLFLLYLASGRLAYLAGGAVLGAAGCTLAALLFAHVRSRFTVWLHPMAFADTVGYQNSQAIFALANGGLTGTGLGRGYPKIPAVHTDMIFAAMAEELGLMGMLAILLLYLIMVTRGLALASRSRDRVGFLIAAGISLTMGLQILLIIGGNTGLLPLTGITLPLLSYGGSSLVATLFCLGAVSGISQGGEVRGFAD